MKFFLCEPHPFSLRQLDSYLVRGFFILPLGVFGILHFCLPSFFEKMVPSYAGSPAFWVYFSGVALTGASLFIFLKWLPRLVNLLLILFVLTFIVTVDIPNIAVKSGQEQYYFIISLMKDTSLLGGSLVYFFVAGMRESERKG